MPSSISHNSSLNITYTNQTGVALLTLKLYEYEIGGMWDEIDNNSGLGLAIGGTKVYSLEQDNLYKVQITYTSGANTIKQEFEYLVTDITEDIVLDLIQKVVCKCNNVSREKQKIYFQFNRLLMLIASTLSYAWKHHGESTNEYVDSQLASVEQINTRINDFYENCDIEECTNSTCSCQ